jgi:hypothetical protein
MARPRKTSPLDLFADLSKKTELLEREMTAQRAAIERLRENSKRGARPLRTSPAPAAPITRRASR